MDFQDRLIEYEKKRLIIALKDGFSFECLVVEALKDHVSVWVRRDQRKDFNIPRYVRYEAIAYIEPL